MPPCERFSAPRQSGRVGSFRRHGAEVQVLCCKPFYRRFTGRNNLKEGITGALALQCEDVQDEEAGRRVIGRMLQYRFLGGIAALSLLAPSRWIRSKRWPRRSRPLAASPASTNSLASSRKSAACGSSRNYSTPFRVYLPAILKDQEALDSTSGLVVLVQDFSRCEAHRTHYAA